MGRIFEHCPIDLGYTELNTVNGANGRQYTTPSGIAYPSITTILGAMPSDGGLERWKARVGEEEARKVSTRATKRGNAVHGSLEDYVNNTEWSVIKKKYTPDVIESVMNICEVLEANLGKVYGQELPLYSDHLKVAGRVDLVAEFANKNSIIDYKTSKRAKPKEWLESYFVQETAYAIMWEERTKMPIQQIVTVIAVDDMGGAPGCQVVIERRDNWTRRLLEIIKIYEDQQRERILGLR